MRPLRLLRLGLLLLLLVIAFAASARAQGGADTAKARADSARTAAARSDSARAAARPDTLKADTTKKKIDLFGPSSDLGLQLNGRLESKLESTRNERCISSQFFNIASQCTAAFQPAFDFQFNVKTGGTIADRVHVNVDYDSQREFDASNNISLFYQGKKHDLLQRLDVGNVSFDVPASRFITSGIPQGNYGLQAIARIGSASVRAIVAQQKGNVVTDRVFTVGARTQQQVDRDIEDYQVEARRFFFTVDPRRFAGYPNIDVLNAVTMRQLSMALPDSLRPVRITLYRLLIGGQPPNPNGPQFRLIGDPSSRRGQIYEVLRENVDYYVDPSQLWVALARPLNLNNERLVVAYTVHINGRDTTIATTGGTPDVQYAAQHDQLANLLWDPDVRPGDPAFFREIRSIYRVGGEEVRRESVGISIVSGATDGQEKPIAGPAQTFLQLFGLAQLGNPAAFDIQNRLWPRPGDPVSAIGGTASTRVIRDQFLVFPSLQPFARAGLAQPAANPSNDAIYLTPNEYLYSPQHPQSLYRIHVTYQSDGSGGGNGISLGTVQLRPFSERLTLDDGTVLRRDVDYLIDYDIGQVTFLHADTLFTRPRNVSVRFEENPLFATTPTSIFGLASTVPMRGGSLNFIAIGQRQTSTFTRPPLGYESQSAMIAGVNGAFTFDASPITRALAKVSRADPNAPSHLRLDGEFATSLPQPGGSGEAYVESFEGGGGITIPLSDPSWYLSSQPALGARVSSRIGGSSSLDLQRAASLAWQNNGYAPTATSQQPVTFTLQQIDPLTNIVGAGLQQPEQVLWLTLYPLSIGGELNGQTKKYQWLTGNGLPGRRWRSIRQPLGAAGTDLSRVEELQFWALIDTSAVRRKRNPTLVWDFGDVSENTVATGPTQLTVTRNGTEADSLYTGVAVYGRDTLQSERDPFSRSFNQEKNDTGLPGDVIPRLPYTSPDSSGVLKNFAICSRGNTRLNQIGDARNDCTVANGRLDEWDINGDNVLNYDSSQREQERLFRYVVDLSDPKSYVRVGGCAPSPTDSLGPAGVPLCWVLVKVPFGTPLDTINGGPSIQRVRAVRLTMISGEQTPDNAFIQMPIARLQLTGAPWLTRTNRVVAGIGGERTSLGLVFAGVIGTQDRDSTSGLIYDSPPGVVDQADTRLSGLENQRIVINEKSMRLTATTLGKYERAEAYYRFPEGPKNFMQYKELRVWARGRGDGWGTGGELQFYIKIGRDENNFYLYRTPANAGQGQAAWLPEVRLDFDKFYALRARLQSAYLQHDADSISSCTGVDSALIAQSALPVGQISRRYAACADGYMVYTVDPALSPPNLASVQELSVGMVRVDSASSGASRIIPGDTLELWIDDIRLHGVVNTPGYAGQVGLDLSAGDIGNLRVNFSHRDPNFRQLAEAPTYVSDDALDLSTSVRLERFLPASLGYAMPLTVIHSSTANNPLFISRSDIQGGAIAGLRTPHSTATSVALSLRRTAPLEGGLFAPILNNLSASTSVSTANSQSEFQTGKSSLFTAGLDYAVGGDGAKSRMPGWWTGAFGAFPGWIGRSEIVQALRDARFRARPAAFRLSSNYSKGDDSRTGYLTPAASLSDSGRIVTNLTSYWRNAGAVELRPFDALDARWELSSLRDLRRYGESTPTGITASAERSKFLGFDAGLEAERVLSSNYSLTPMLRGWLQPRFDFSTSYALQKDPHSLQLLRAGDTTGAFRLPRRVNGFQSLSAAATLDLVKLAGGWNLDSTLKRRLANTLLPVDINYSRMLTSAFDGTPFDPGLGFQLGLGGENVYLRDHGLLSTSAGSNAQVTLSSGLRLPFGITLAARTQRVATRNWLRRADQTQAIVDGEQVTIPDLTLRATFHPRALEQFIQTIGASARLIETRQRSVVPSGSPLVPDDIRTGRVLSYPLTGNIVWNERGALAMSFSVASTWRTDSLPGSVTDSRQHDVSADIARSFVLPKDWQMRSSLRTRLAYQQTSASSYVLNGFAAGGSSRLADNGRQAITLNADTDVSQDLTFSLQSARIVTFDNNIDRRFTQIVLSAVLQIKFYAGELR